jgi:hypothetical protein
MISDAVVSFEPHDAAPPAPFPAALYYSVEFKPKTLGTVYQSKIRDRSPDGFCVLVKSSSRVLPHLNVGDTLVMKYYPVDRNRPDAVMQTRIQHITQEASGKFKGHVRVGLAPVGG